MSGSASSTSEERPQPVLGEKKLLDVCREQNLKAVRGRVMDADVPRRRGAELARRASSPRFRAAGDCRNLVLVVVLVEHRKSPQINESH